MSLYLDSELDYTYSVLRNGSVIDVEPSQLSAEWYASPSLSDLRAEGPTRLPVADPNDLSGLGGNYIELVLTYSNGSDVVSTYFYSPSQVNTSNRPMVFDTWYSGIEMSESPATATAVANLFSRDTAVETEPPGPMSYRVDFYYYSDASPFEAFDTLALLAQSYPRTSTIRVDAFLTSFSNPNDVLPLSERFSYIGDDIYLLRTVAKPRLQHETPLHPNDTIGLQDVDQVLADIDALTNDLTIDIAIYFEWQESSDQGESWVIAEGEVQNSTSYSNYSNLSEGKIYRLKLTSTSRNGVGNSDTLYSDVSTQVQSSTQTNYDILFDDVQTPQVSVSLPVSTDLLVNGAAAPFSGRAVRWEGVDPDGVISYTANSDTYTPRADDVGSKLRVTVTYFDDQDLPLVSRDLTTETVIAAPTDTDMLALLDSLSSSLPLTPDGVSVGTVVSLTSADQAAIDASSVNVAYEWQEGEVGSWLPLAVNQTNVSYTAQTGNIGKRLRLKLTLTAGGEEVERVSQYTSEVQPNEAKLETFTLFLEFDRDESRLSLTDASTTRLDKLIEKNNISTSDYAWLRIPANSGFDAGVVVGNEKDGYILGPADEGFSHALRVTLTKANNESSMLFSAITLAWDGNQYTGDGSDLELELTRLRYMDVLTLQGGSTPALGGDELRAVLSGSIDERDIEPSNITYTWYSGESPIGESTDVYIVDIDSVAGTTLRVKANWTDNLDKDHSLISDERLVSTDSDTQPWSVILSPTVEPATAGQLFSATHRELAENEEVEYRWYRLSRDFDWDSKSSIYDELDDTKKKLPHYEAQYLDDGYWLGVEALLIVDGKEVYRASDVTRSAVTISNSGDSLSFSLNITPHDIYIDSDLDYNVSLIRNNEAFTKSDLLALGVELTPKWYSVKELSDVIKDPSEWREFTPTSNLEDHKNRYLVLSLVYEDLFDIVSLTAVSAKRVLDNQTPQEFGQWYSNITLDPLAPATRYSKVSLEKSNDNESIGPDNDRYTVDFQLFSNKAPLQKFDDLSELAMIYPETSLVTVYATLKSDELVRLLSADFIFSDDDVHSLLVVDLPLLQHSIPLYSDGYIGLLNEFDVVSGVNDLIENSDVFVTYQWEVSEDNGERWGNALDGSYTYHALSGSLLEGAQYRLAILGENARTGNKQRIESDLSDIVTTKDQVHGLLDVTVPLLQYELPLYTDGYVGLQNESDVVDGVNDLIENSDVLVTYQWEVSEDNGERWSNALDSSYTYHDLSGLLLEGAQYRLALLGKNEITGNKQRIESEWSAYVSKKEEPILGDIDGDGIPDQWDNDIDGDGVVNELDINPTVASETHDIDGDGISDDLIDLDLRSVEIVSERSYDISAQEIVKFIPISLANGGVINTASAYLGRISVVDNTLVYAAPLDMPQQIYIEYEVTLSDGSVVKELLLLVNENYLSGDRPRFVDVAPIDILATGLFTPIGNLAPEATDAIGNPIPVSLETNKFRLRPGNNIVYWRASDNSQNTTQITAQLIRVHPQIEFGQLRMIYEGTQSTINVYLNGLSPVYPLIIPVIIDTELSTSNEQDHSLLATQNVVIESGLKGELTFDITADNEIEGIETLALTFSDEINVGPNKLQVLEINETSPRPKIKAKVVDELGNQKSLVPSELDNLLYLDIEILGTSIPLNLYWSHSYGQDEKVSLGMVSNGTTIPLPWPLANGRHRFHVEGVPIESEGEPVFSSVDIRVIDTVRLSLDKDSDNDGISDLAEGMNDSDGDLIPDYLDMVDSCELQVIDNERATNGGFVLQSTAGSCVMLGQVSDVMNEYSPYVRGGDASSEASIPFDEDYVNQFSNSDLSNFVITNVLEESVSIVLPLMQPYGQGSVFRKYTESSGWFDFNTNEDGSSLRYALGEFGFCPPPGSIEYQDNPLIGSYCLEVTLRDGGVHDHDGERNGVVDDPAYMVYFEGAYSFSSIFVIHYYDTQSLEKEYDVQFDVCDYIELKNCELDVIGFSTPLSLFSQTDGTKILVKVPAGEENLVGYTLIEIDGIPYRIETIIQLIATEESPSGDSSGDSNSGGGGSFGLWLLCLVLFRLYLINFATKSIHS
ncbi:thrombospondin type 3 repeat-containing protein [Photobacterium leiognathi]|nr:thrombospondin type 3 repeat-containing protein [Photobacterium leiognathi]